MADNETAGDKKIPKGLQIVLFVVFLIIGVGVAYLTGSLTPKPAQAPTQQQAAPAQPPATP